MRLIRTLKRRFEQQRAELVALRECRDSDRIALDLLARDPAQVMLRAGVQPDPWQQEVLASDADQMLLLASRQSGKSEVAAALAMRTALLVPRSPVLLLSPSLRQSGELFRKVINLFNAL